MEGAGGPISVSATTFEKKTPGTNDDSSYNRFAPCFSTLSSRSFFILYPPFIRTFARKIEEGKKKRVASSRNSDSVSYVFVASERAEARIRHPSSLPFEASLCVSLEDKVPPPPSIRSGRNGVVDRFPFVSVSAVFLFPSRERERRREFSRSFYGNAIILDLSLFLSLSRFSSYFLVA